MPSPEDIKPDADGLVAPSHVDSYSPALSAASLAAALTAAGDAVTSFSGGEYGGRGGCVGRCLGLPKPHVAARPGDALRLAPLRN